MNWFIFWSQFHQKLVLLADFMDLLHCQHTSCRNFVYNKIRIVIPQSQKSKIVILNKKISLVIVGNSQLKLKTSSIVILVIDLCEVISYSFCRSMRTQRKDQMWLHRIDNPRHDLCIFGIPFFLSNNRSFIS